MEKHDLQWYQDRIGKRVFRTKSSCVCEVCELVYQNGILIGNKQHAHYLFDCQNELGLYYADSKEELNAN